MSTWEGWVQGEKIQFAETHTRKDPVEIRGKKEEGKNKVEVGV